MRVRGWVAAWAPCSEHAEQAELLMILLIGIDYWLLAPFTMTIIGCCMFGGVDISRNGLEPREARFDPQLISQLMYTRLIHFRRQYLENEANTPVTQNDHLTAVGWSDRVNPRNR